MKNLKKKTMMAMLSLAMTFTAFGAVGGVTALAAEGEHTHTYTNGFCETVAGETHYEAPTLNNNGTESNTADDYYEIGNAGELYWFAEHVNYKENNTAPNTKANAKLTANIVVNENVLVNGEWNEEKKDTLRVWTPIGIVVSGLGGYMGTFDGQGFTVSGLYVNDAETSYVGLFSRDSDSKTRQAATIQNVGVIDSYFRGNRYVAGIVGQSNDGSKIINCYSDCLIYGSSYLGGISSYAMNDCTIKDCYSTSTIKAEQNMAGGILGADSPSSENVIENCYYLTGSVTDAKGALQYGIGFPITGQMRPDVEGQTKGFATVGEIYKARFLNGTDTATYVDYLENQIAEADKANADEIERLQSELDTAKQALETEKGELAAKDEALEKAAAENKAAIEAAMNEADSKNKTLGVIGLVFGTVSFAGVAAMAVLTFLKKKKS